MQAHQMADCMQSPQAVTVPPKALGLCMVKTHNEPTVPLSHRLPAIKSRKVDRAGLKHLLRLTVLDSIEKPRTGVTLSDAKAYMTKESGAKVFLE